MAVPSRESLISAVDLEFSKQHPSAPEHLNPDDPGQAHLVQAWRELYTQQLNLSVDRVFFSFYPDAPADVVSVTMDIDDAGRGPALHWLETALGSAEAFARGLADPPPERYSANPDLSPQEKEGYCYSLLWEVCGQYDAEKGFADTADVTAEQLREAFYAGVGAGLNHGAWPILHNRVLLLVGYRTAHGDHSSAGYEWVLNLMRHNIDNTPRDLTWPIPRAQH